MKTVVENKHQRKNKVFPEGDRISILARQAGEGNRHAFEQLVELFHGRIFRMVYCRIGSRMDSEDLTQEIFIKAYRKVGTLRDPGRFGSWLYRIALNRIRDFGRKQKLYRLLGLEKGKEQADAKGEGDNGFSRMEKPEFWKHVDRLLAMLGKREREIFMLRFLDQLGIREIAELLGRNESTIKTHLYRGVRKFRKNKELLILLKGETHGP